MIEEILSTTSKEKRLVLIDKVPALPVKLVEDLLCLNIDSDEKWLLVHKISSQNPLELEHFLTQGMIHYEQNFAARLVDEWAGRTQNVLWFRLPLIAKSRHCTQRIRYRILANCHLTNPGLLLESVLEGSGIEESSYAFAGLLLKRSCEWNVDHSIAKSLAKTTLTSVCSGTLQTNRDDPIKALTSAMCWLLKFDQKTAMEFIDRRGFPEHIQDFLDLLSPRLKGNIQTTKGLRIPKQDSNALRAFLLDVWPPIWVRQHLQLSDIRALYSVVRKMPNPAEHRHAFYGCDRTQVMGYISSIDDPTEYANALKYFHGYVMASLNSDVFSQTRDFLQKVENPHDFLNQLPAFLRLCLRDDPKRLSAATEAYLRDAQIEDGLFPGHQSILDEQTIRSKKDQDASNNEHVLGDGRRQFFDMAYRGRTSTESSGRPSEFWRLLHTNWRCPEVKHLQDMATEARKAPPIFKSCYIDTLGRFVGSDEAALKLLDFVRTTNDSELRSVALALSGIGTPRALQELISMITRTHTPVDLGLEICELLHQHELTDLQPELRSCIADLGSRSASDQRYQEMQDSLTALLTVYQSTAKVRQLEQTNSNTTISEPHLDRELDGRIPHYSQLSSEVKRALRTAQFFSLQIENQQQATTIDQSPLIDMQYKALELLFRESFEHACFLVISNGVLQRKLDIIGYARPIPQAMNEFEDYIHALPAVRDIPHFSKFKLRKLLRAICNFRPGKRFTLDGIKAFGLFFLVFARSNCRYGLDDIVSLPFASDHDLYGFCSDLHIFQDFRNRAAHEGFRPEARRDVDMIWQSTARIVRVVFSIRDQLVHESSNLQESAQDPQSRIENAS